MQCLDSVQNLVFLIQVVGFPIGLSPRTMQCLGSVQNLVFLIQVVGFPIGLSPRTMQCLGSVQNLVFSLHGALAWGLGFRGVSSPVKPLEFIYTINVTKRLVCSLQGALALGELAPQPSP